MLLRLAKGYVRVLLNLLKGQSQGFNEGVSSYLVFFNVKLEFQLVCDDEKSFSYLSKMGNCFLSITNWYCLNNLTILDQVGCIGAGCYDAVSRQPLMMIDVDIIQFLRETFFNDPYSILGMKSPEEGLATDTDFEVVK